MTGIKLWLKAMELGHKLGCHQIPERSFGISGYQFPVCARCTGILLGQIAAFLIPPLRRLSIWKDVALLFPMALDGGTQFLGLQKSTNRRRLITGLLGGIGYAALLCNVAHRLLRHFSNAQTP